MPSVLPLDGRLWWGQDELLRSLLDPLATCGLVLFDRQITIRQTARIAMGTSLSTFPSAWDGPERGIFIPGKRGRIAVMQRPARRYGSRL